MKHTHIFIHLNVQLCMNIECYNFAAYRYAYVYIQIMNISVHVYFFHICYFIWMVAKMVIHIANMVGSRRQITWRNDRGSNPDSIPEIITRLKGCPDEFGFDHHPFLQTGYWYGIVQVYLLVTYTITSSQALSADVSKNMPLLVVVWVTRQVHAEVNLEWKC